MRLDVLADCRRRAVAVVAQQGQWWRSSWALVQLCCKFVLQVKKGFKGCVMVWPAHCVVSAYCTRVAACVIGTAVCGVL